MITDSRFDGGKPFDWGRTSGDYAKYRDIYPRELYERLAGLGLCVKGQRVLDLGTGTGVLPRNMYGYGAKFIGTDIAQNQILQAKRLAAEQGMDIRFEESSAEELDFPDGSFDVITACQCFFYFNHGVLAPKAHRLLKAGGSFAAIYMAWLPFEDETAMASEELVLKYNPTWNGCKETRHDLYIPDDYNAYFDKTENIFFDADIPFTRESWGGRIRACRGVGASLSEDKIAEFDREHTALLEKIAPESFTIKHYCTIVVLKAK